MEKQFSSDSEQASEEKPSISLAGLLDSAEIPNLKELFRDKDVGVAACHILGERHYIHSEIFGEKGKEKLALVQEISAMIDEKFKEHGVETLWTMAETDEQYRYNIFLGYTPTGNEVLIPGYPNHLYEFRKDL